jgi:hypothetical protein
MLQQFLESHGLQEITFCSKIINILRILYSKEEQYFFFFCGATACIEPWPPLCIASKIVYPWPLFPSNLVQSSHTPSCHLFLGFSTALLPYIVCCRAFLGVCSSFKHITCLPHCNFHNLLNTDTLTSLYRSYISVLYLILHSPSACLGPYIRLKIFLSKASST